MGVVARVIVNGLVAHAGLFTGDRAFVLPTGNIRYFLVTAVNQRHAAEWIIDVFNPDVCGDARQQFWNGAKCAVLSCNGYKWGKEKDENGVI